MERESTGVGREQRDGRALARERMFSILTFVITWHISFRVHTQPSADNHFHTNIPLHWHV